MSEKPQPSDEMEAENAAYLLLESCQVELRKAAGLDVYREATHAEIVWHFERYRRAYERHKALEDARREKRA